MAALRIFIALANEYGFVCHECDIEITFVHAVLTVECFMEIPLGYVQKEGEMGKSMCLKKGTVRTEARST